MKTEEDKLRGLFQKMKLDEPSIAFENKLMERIHAIEKEKEKRGIVRSYVAVACGVVAVLGIPSLIFWLLGLKLPFDSATEFGLDFAFPKLTIDPLIVSIVGVALILLIGDTLIRKRIKHKKEEEK